MKIKKYTADDFRKVTVSINAATHLTDPEREGYTLCGRRWWFDCALGTDHYCRHCQRRLSWLYTPRSYT